MNFLNFVLFFASLIMIIKHYRFVIENIPLLPEKIPIHFNFKGKADGWLKKGFFSIYPFLIVNACQWSVMLILFFNEQIKPQWFFPVLSLIITIQLFVAHKGIIFYALEKTSNIWNYMAIILVMLPFEILLLFTVKLYEK
jgi:hypothetical protein